MNFKHSPISNFHKQGLVTSIVMLLMICKGKKYCVGNLGMGHVGVGLDNC